MECVKGKAAVAKKDTGSSPLHLPDSCVNGLLRMSCFVLCVTTDGQDAILTCSERRDWPKHLLCPPAAKCASLFPRLCLGNSLVPNPVPCGFHIILHNTLPSDYFSKHTNALDTDTRDIFYGNNNKKKKRWGNVC